MIHFVAAAGPFAAAVARAARLSSGSVVLSASAGAGTSSGAAFAGSVPSAGFAGSVAGSAFVGSVAGGSAAGSGFAGSVAGGSVTLSAELASGGFVFGSVPCDVVEPGRVVVPIRSLATVLAGIAGPSAVLRVEGTRLAVRTPTARFALPLLPSPVTEPPDVPVLGIASGLRDAAAVVAGAASRDGLALFTGVRVRSSGSGLTLAATDRFRAAFASVSWHPSSPRPVDALVPAPVLAAAARYASAQTVVRSGGGWFGLDWTGGGLAVPGLALPFPDAQLDALATTTPVCVVDVEVESLRGAVDRVAPFAGDGVWLEVVDGAVVVRAAGELGEAREEVKASTTGDLCTQRFQAGYLTDAVRALAGERARIELQQGIRPTLFQSEDLRYLVVPLRTV